MKNNFLLLLFLMLATHSVFSQKTLAPSLKPYSENWSYNIKQLLSRAGFDLQVSSPNKVSSRSPLQLDSTKTYFDYNQPAPGDSTPILRSNYTYPSADTKIEINYQFENGDWRPLSRFTSVSDDQQRLVDVIAEGFYPDAQAFQFDSRLRVFPHGNSQALVDSVLIFAWDSTLMDWHETFAIRNTFDAQDRLSKSVSSTDLLGDPLIFEEIYSYDANGDNHLIEEFAIIGNDEFPSSRTDIAYADHQQIEVTVSVFNGLGFLPQSRSNYAYTTFGALRLNMSFEWNAAKAKWDLTQRIEYGFSGERLASATTIQTAPDGSETRQLVTFAYIEDENLSLEMNFNWDDDLFDWVLDTKKHYYYNGLVSADPEPGKALALQIVPNPTVDAVRLTLENEALVQVFSHTGQLMQSSLMQPGQLLNLTTISAGVYQITARQGSDFYIGKVVKQ